MRWQAEGLCFDNMMLDLALYTLIALYNTQQTQKNNTRELPIVIVDVKRFSGPSFFLY